MTASVLTIARGRDAHLRNVAAGLARQTVPPRELVIAHMRPEPYDGLGDMPFPVRQVHVPGDDLPLARARNAAADTATGDDLIFLDVDCIPGPTLVADYVAALRDHDGLAMGEVLYLPAGATEAGLDYAAFDAQGQRHSDRRAPPAGPMDICRDYRCFWSLTFAIRAGTFHAVAGFDERFTGYGGEDTDFAKSIDRAGTPIYWIRGARVYHQYHPHHMPPIYHIESVVRNSELFARKWGYRTMEHWLLAFRLMGLIGDAPGGGLRILRTPDAADLALTRQDRDAPYVNTARVIRAIRARMAQVTETTAAE